MKIGLFSLGKTDVYLHPATLVMAGYMALCGKAGLFLAAMASIVVHESAHAIAARAMGDCPLSIEITPLGALMRLEDEGRLPPLRRLTMLLAGPAMTLILCLLALWGTARGILTVETGRMLFVTNAGLLLINMLPCLPLDGGRVVFLLLEQWLGTGVSRRVMRAIGVIIGSGILLVSLWISWQKRTVQFTLAACGCVVLYASHVSTTTAALAEMRQWMERKIRLEQRGVMRVKRFAVLESFPLRRVIKMMPQYAWGEFMILESGTLRQLGLYSETEAINAYLNTPGGVCRLLVKHMQSE